ncbi:MAG: hypothetical protein ABWZ40_10765 [Caulobacterales bacterium]
MRPRLYYDTHVVKNFEIWGAEPTSIYNARQATVAADSMADRLFDYFTAHRPKGLRGAPTPGGYRRLLIDWEPDYQIVWDAARNMLPLNVSRLPILAADREHGDVLVASQPVVAAKLRTGQQIVLRASVGKVIKLWERVLDDNRL